jgi:eukaryotic-like serine/threonine-protein kinase
MAADNESPRPKEEKSFHAEDNAFTQGPNVTSPPGGSEPSAKSSTDLLQSLPPRYVVEKRLGKGGMGQVYLATDVGELGQGTRQVAIKLIVGHLTNHPTTYEKFVKEMHTAELLEHENIVQVLTHGKTTEGYPYLVMQYVAGGSLQDRIRDQKALSVAEVIDLGLQICTALMVSHGHGIIHRDIKPANILVREELYPRRRIVAKLSDFGLARTLESSAHSMFGAVGTYGYRSPEQRTGGEVDGRSDLYGLGATLLHLVTGEAPEGPLDWDDVPTLMRPLLKRALAKRPADRYATAEQMYEALELCQQELRGSTTTAAKSLPPSPSTDTTAVGNSRSQAAPIAKPTLSESLANSIGMEFRLIQPGTFMMGSPSSEAGRGNAEKQHQVTLTRPYYLGIYPVTQEQYERVIGTNPSQFKGARHPVEKVSWEDAQEFISKLNGLSAEQSAGRKYRLPTEAEWEYACRASTKTAYSFGDDPKVLGKYGWFGENSGSKTHPVGEKQPNPWGLYDMHGNVWEWCEDRYGAYPAGAVIDPTGNSEDSSCVSRGGSWCIRAAFCRSADRNWAQPSSRFVIRGFRVALSPAGIPQ